MTRRLLHVAVCVIVPVFAAAGAQDPAPPADKIRAAIEKGEYHEALKMISQAERGLGVSSRGERYALLMLKGNMLQRAGSPAYAADAYNDAMRVAAGRRERALARAAAVLARHAATGGAELASDELPAAARGGGADKEQMRRLYESIRRQAEPEVKAAAEGTTLPPMYDLLPSLADLASLELAADESIEKTLPLLKLLGGRARELIDGELHTLESRAADVERAAGEAQYVTGRGFIGRRGLHTNDRKALEQMIPYLARIEGVTRDGRRIAELLEAPAAVEQWEDLGVKASDIADQVQSALNRQY